MAYINIDIDKLELYYTQKGREYILTGDTRDYTIKAFSLGDSDVNYFVRNTDKINTDFSGTGGDCLKSVADGVDIQYQVLIQDIPLPVVGFITDNSLVQIGNEEERIRLRITDGLPRSYDVRLRLNCNILSNLQWFNAVQYKNNSFSNFSDFSDVVIDIPSGQIESDVIIFTFNELIKPNPQPNENITITVQIVAESNVSFVESPITIVRQQPQINIEADITTTRFACGLGGTSDIFVLARGGVGLYTYTLINNLGVIVGTNATGVFTNISSGTYNIRILDSQNNQRVIQYEVVSFPVSTAIITNTQDISVNQANGTVTVQTNNAQIRNTFRLRDALNNTVLLEHLGAIGETVYTFQIPESLLNIVENTPTIFRRERRFYIEVFNQVCGATNSSQFTIRDIRPLFVIDQIRCEQVNGATRTNSNRVFSEKDININSSTYNQPRRDLNGNIVFMFFDVNPLQCPLPLGNARIQIDARSTPLNFSIQYTNISGNLITTQLNNTVGRFVDLVVFPNSTVTVTSTSNYNYNFTGSINQSGTVDNFNRTYITPQIIINTTPSILVLSTGAASGISDSNL